MVIDLTVETRAHDDATKELLPLIREWFGLKDDAPIMEDVRIRSFLNGGVMEISLITKLTNEQVQMFMDRARGI